MLDILFNYFVLNKTPELKLLENSYVLLIDSDLNSILISVDIYMNEDIYSKIVKYFVPIYFYEIKLTVFDYSKLSKVTNHLKIYCSTLEQVEAYLYCNYNVGLHYHKDVR